MSSLSQTLHTDNGFLPAVFVFNPLPYRDPGDHFSKTIRDTTLSLVSHIGCPYGKTGRSVLSLITTEAVKKKQQMIDLGGVADTFRKLDLSPTGGKRGTIRYVTEQFHRIANTHVDLSRSRSGPNYQGVEEVHFTFARRLSLFWNTEGEPHELPRVFDNFLELSQDCFEYITAHAVPILLEPYFSISSPREQDFYAWLVRRLWSLHDQQLVRWESLYEQFGPISRTNKPSFRADVSKYLYHIKTEFYPQAHVQTTDEGVLLYPSPPLVEPGSAKAGYLP